ncbi:MAG: response regulator transcription factor [Marinoscillum sp.]
MDTLKILVAEDNLMHASKMEMTLDQMGYDLLGIYANQKDFLEAFVIQEPDLVILDIELEGGTDGVNMAKTIQQIRPVPVIFATSFEDRETMNRAMQTDPYAYLIKPVAKAGLQAAIELAIHKFAKQSANTGSSHPESFDEAAILFNSFFVKSGSKLQKVRLDDIQWVEVAQDRYCDLVTTDRKFQVRSSLNQLEQKLDPGKFLRIHRAVIVNLNHIEGIDEIDMVVEIGGQSLPLGGAYKAALLAKVKMI